MSHGAAKGKARKVAEREHEPHGSVNELGDIPPAWRTQFPIARRIGTRLCGLQKFLFSTGLMVDLRFPDPVQYEYSHRYCYEHAADARQALATWDGQGDPPGPWAKEKVSGRLGPGLLEKDEPRSGNEAPPA